MPKLSACRAFIGLGLWASRDTSLLLRAACIRVASIPRFSMGTSNSCAMRWTHFSYLITSISTTARCFPMTDSDRKSGSSIWTLISPLILILGFGLVTVSLFWPSSSMSRASWTPEQAKQYQSASVKLHSLTHVAAHPSKDADLQAQKKELEQA